MLVCRTPLRIPLGGGGTDLPSFYKKFGSFFISAAIDHYSYVAVKHRPIKGIRLGYSHTEEVQNITNIKHPIIKAALQTLRISSNRGLEIVSIGDIPAGTGMGSSGSFTVGLLNALYHLKNQTKSAHLLAEKACTIAMGILKEPSGKQDEYIGAYGGITCFEISKKGIVTSYPLAISKNTLQKLQKNLLLFYTGIIRDSKTILQIQKEQTDKNDLDILNNLKKTQEIAFEIKKALEKGDTTLFGELLDRHWAIKRKRVVTTSKQIDIWYDIAKSNGALGGKILGAGGGGFFAFYCEDKKEKLRLALKKEGLEEVKFKFEFEGSKVFSV